LGQPLGQPLGQLLGQLLGQPNGWDQTSSIATTTNNHQQLTMSDTGLACVYHIRETIRRINTVEDLPSISTWFMKPTDGSNIKLVPYKALANHADKELEEWYSLPEGINYHCNFNTQLRKWIQQTSDEELAQIINTSPSGGDGIVFTPWQRLYMAFICKRRFDCTSKIEITTEQLESFKSSNDSSRKRKLPFSAQYSVRKGTCLNINIMKLATAGGKTSSACSIAWMLCSSYYDEVVQHFINAQMSQVFAGDPSIAVPRLVIVAGPGGVHQHWISEYRRLSSEFRRMSPHLTQLSWDGQSKHYSTLIASGLQNTVVFWFLPISKLNEEMRRYPAVAVLCVITDEMTIDVPREKTATTQSPVVVRLLPQATPSALCQSTRGCTSWLRQAMDGELEPPNKLGRYLKYSNYKESQKLIEQRTKLNFQRPNSIRFGRSYSRWYASNSCQKSPCYFDFTS
jgi:hypothetical protein